MKNILIFSVVLLVIGCKEKPAEIENTDQSEALSEQIVVETNRKVSLIPQAREKVNTWLAYATATNQIEALKTATGTEIVQSSQPLIQIMEALENTMPDSLQVPAVNARVNVLLTKARILDQKGRKKHTEAEEIFKTANSIIVAFDNFKIQLNEVFLKTPEDFEEALDSIFLAESTRDSLVVDSLVADSLRD
ncbi:MAG TPA: hypothetical protein VFI78_00415 [Salinimicrobium sp.]|nr:hypothetical protein [Salinimicrobium sp.]